MTTLSTDDPVAVAVVGAIHSGDVATLRRLLGEHPGLATARLGDSEPGGMSRTLLHVVTDWPGHFPNGAVTVAALVEAGADVNARFRGPHEETPLHWAASSDDVDVLDALPPDVSGDTPLSLWWIRPSVSCPPQCRFQGSNSRASSTRSLLRLVEI